MCIRDSNDSFEDHVADTLDAGAGLCNEQAVRTIVEEGPDAIRELPGFPGPAGLIHRLDGAEKRQRKLEKARCPGVDENGFISLPPAWEGKVLSLIHIFPDLY